MSKATFKNEVVRASDFDAKYGGVLAVKSTLESLAGYIYDVLGEYDLTDLDTTAQTDLISAINEVHGELDDVKGGDVFDTLYMGTLSAADAVVLTDDNVVPLQINKLSSANPSSSVTLMGGYVRVANDTEDQEDLQLVGLGTRVMMGKNVDSAYGLQSHVGTGEAMATGVSHANIAAISGKIDMDHDITQGNVQAGLFILEGVGSIAEESSIIQAHIENGTTAGNGITLAGRGTVTNAINIALNPSQADISLSTGAKIFSGSAANPAAVYAEVGSYDAIGSFYLSTGGALFFQVADNGEEADWETVTRNSR